ncbi:hypothetical protein [Mesorhizobium huakuii]|uniref:Uncharacterized protein n=1 Tax=Mesorhizobium huakuii TaxID=28104 RepID=A0ABZ0W0N4_9HYPH|nr:hypothetical protein [Mesorhizobium huakuii]WQC02614.1 hypothetical protein U0R22_006867 [Mesorhizobium huakuii]
MRERQVPQDAYLFMGTSGAELFAKSVARDHPSDDRVAAIHSASRILEAEKAAAKSERAEATTQDGMPKVVDDQHGLSGNEIPNPLTRVIVAAYRSDFFPVLLLLTGYMLFAFGAALILLLWLIAHPA